MELEKSSDSESEITDLEDTEEEKIEEDEPESEIEEECAIWDEETIILPIKLESVQQLYGFHLIPWCKPEPTFEPPSKQRKYCPEIRNDLIPENFVENFNLKWKMNEELKKDDIELLVQPFKVCIIKNFLQETSIISQLIEECNKLTWNIRSLDLYEFSQSPDLKDVDSEYFQIMYTFLKNNVKGWIEQLTGLKLTNISATCSLYGDTDYLLLHDDQQDDRLIAFVYYFTKPIGWAENFGGALQLFDKDEMGQPRAVVRNIFPCNNQFVFFQVTNDSYHQVKEVRNKSDCRFTINGWFHTDPPPVFEIKKYIPPSNGLFSENSLEPLELDLDTNVWLNQFYVDDSSIKFIKEQIQEESEVSLHNYFNTEVIEEVFTALQSSDIKWVQVGPPNRRLYEVALEEGMPEELRQFLNLFRSQDMFKILKEYTELNLTSVRYEMQRWKPGNYSLLSDYDWSKRNELDVVLYFGGEFLSEIIGGRVMYISPDETVQEALVTIIPQENSLNIVYRDTARIIKYFSESSKCKMFYLLICSYSEP